MSSSVAALQFDIIPQSSHCDTVFHVHPCEDATGNEEHSDLQISETDERGAPTPAADGSNSRDQLLSLTCTTAGEPVDTVDLHALVPDGVSAFVDRIQYDLDDAIQDARETGEPAPTKAAYEACLRLARRVAPLAALAPRLKRAAFTEETGAVSLVLQSLVTDRRVDFRIAVDGRVIDALRIDENMHPESFAFSVDQSHSPRELARWVTNRA